MGASNGQQAQDLRVGSLPLDTLTFSDYGPTWNLCEGHCHGLNQGVGAGRRAWQCTVWGPLRAAPVSGSPSTGSGES